MFSLLSKIYCPIKKGRFEANSSFITQISMTPGKLNVKIKLQKIIGNLLGKLQKFYMSGTVIYKFVAVVKRQFVCEQMFYSNVFLCQRCSVWCLPLGSLAELHKEFIVGCRK